MPYFHLRRLRAIRHSVSSHVFTSIVHAFVCSRIDYCNSLLVGLPKVRLSPIQYVLNATAKLIARLPRTSHISAFMFDHLHWLPLIARIKLKVLTFIYRERPLHEESYCHLWDWSKTRGYFRQGTKGCITSHNNCLLTVVHYFMSV